MKTHYKLLSVTLLFMAALFAPAVHAESDYRITASVVEYRCRGDFAHYRRNVIGNDVVNIMKNTLRFKINYDYTGYPTVDQMSGWDLSVKRVCLNNNSSGLTSVVALVNFVRNDDGTVTHVKVKYPQSDYRHYNWTPAGEYGLLNLVYDSDCPDSETEYIYEVSEDGTFDIADYITIPGQMDGLYAYYFSYGTSTYQPTSYSNVAVVPGYHIIANTSIVNPINSSDVAGDTGHTLSYPLTETEWKTFVFQDDRNSIVKIENLCYANFSTTPQVLLRATWKNTDTETGKATFALETYDHDADAMVAQDDIEAPITDKSNYRNSDGTRINTGNYNIYCMDNNEFNYATSPYYRDRLAAAGKNNATYLDRVTTRVDFGDGPVENTYMSWSTPVEAATVSASFGTEEGKVLATPYAVNKQGQHAYAIPLTITPTMPPVSYLYNYWDAIEGIYMYRTWRDDGSGEVRLDTVSAPANPAPGHTLPGQVTWTMPSHEYPTEFYDYVLHDKLEPGEEFTVNYRIRMYAYSPISGPMAPRRVQATDEPLPTMGHLWMDEKELAVTIKGGDNIITALEWIPADAQVAGVTYYNTMGQASTRPWQGMNIVVNRYADGTTRSSKSMH